MFFSTFKVQKDLFAIMFVCMQATIPTFSSPMNHSMIVSRGNGCEILLQLNSFAFEQGCLA
jgi:hypothetical protein